MFVRIRGFTIRGLFASAVILTLGIALAVSSAWANSNPPTCEFVAAGLTFGEFRGPNRPLPGICGGKFQHRLETVLRLLRQHGLSLQDC